MPCAAVMGAAWPARHRLLGSYLGTSRPLVAAAIACAGAASVILDHPPAA